jgi:hypothetical protein
MLDYLSIVPIDRSMKVLTCWLAKLLLLTVILSGSAFAVPVSGDGLELQKTPTLTTRQRENFPVNLARANLGAEIKSSRPGAIVDSVFGTIRGEEANQSEFGLISSDSSISYPLPVGETAFVITLPFLSANNLFTFGNDNGGQGKVSVFMAPSTQDFSSPKWKKACEPVSFTSNGPIKVSFPMIEGLAVKVEFQMTKAGRINGFGIFGETKNSGLVEKPKQVKELQPITQIVNYNYADITTSPATVSHVSSYGPSYDLAKAYNMIDDNTGSYYDFSPTDVSPTVVVDLGFTESIRRITANYETGPGVVEFYVMNKLPDGNERGVDAKTGIPQILVLPADFFERYKPFRVVETSTEKRKASTTFDLTPMRYIMLRWVADKSAVAQNLTLPSNPDYFLASLHSSSLLPFLLAQATPPSAPGVRVMEINAFGNTVKRRYGLDRSRERALDNSINPPNNIPKDPPLFPTPVVSP